MTRNLTIATIFLLASTLLLGYIWVRENSVLAQRTERFDGALLTRGARDYEQYCAGCHGLTGEGGVANGAPQINNLPNTLGTRLDGPTGIVAKYGTVRNFVEATVTSGVRGTAMPRWSARLGGPLRDDQIQNIAAYVSSWWGPQGSTSPNISADAAAAAALYKKAQQAAASAGAPDTPIGRGQAIFTANCASCHNLNDKDSGVPAPGLGGLFGPDGTAAFGKKLPNGKDVTAADWIEWVKKGGGAFASQAIQPASGFGPYQIAAMPPFPQFDDKQIGDLLAFLSSHDRTGNQSLPPLGTDGNPLPASAAGGTAGGTGGTAATPSAGGAAATPAAGGAAATPVAGSATAAPAAGNATAAPAGGAAGGAGADLVSQGQTVFQANCAACHNLNNKDSAVPAPGLGGLFGPDGTAALGKKLPNGKDVTVDNWIEWITKGGAAFAGGTQAQPASGFGPYQIAAMPPFAQLTQDQIKQLLAFISTHDRDGNQTLPPLGTDGKPLQ